jgi:hypothetical protein
MRQRTHAPPYRVHFCRCRAHSVGRSMLCWTLADLDMMILPGYQLSTHCDVLVEISSTVLLLIGCTCCSLGQDCYISILSRRMPFRYLSTCVPPGRFSYVCMYVFSITFPFSFAVPNAGGMRQFMSLQLSDIASQSFTSDSILGNSFTGYWCPYHPR